MLKIVTIIATAASLGLVLAAAPANAQSRFGAGAIADAVAGVPSAQPAQYYGRYRGYHAPRYYSRGYYGYRHYGYKNSRDALATCAYC